MNHSKKPAFDEPLAGFVLGDLSEEEYRELRDLPEDQRKQKLNELERLASTVSLASIDPNESLPEKLRVSITHSGRSIVAEMGTRPTLRTTELRTTERSSSSTGRLREAVAWLACLAATILAIAFWQKSGQKIEPPAVPTWTRDSLMASAPDVIQVPWADGKTPLGQKVIGDIVWSNKLQRGFMRFVGMPVNDPTVEQYQLWIIDPSRDDEPIDGGVFDIASTEETIVPIQAKLLVNQPTAFAVTIEKPGGVVVSTQERLPLLANVQKTKWIRFQNDATESLFASARAW
jgi:anti-sigma-K factor RskA